MKQLSLIIISILFVACSSEDDSLPPTLAEVSTSGVLDITQTSANSGGEITSSGGEEITAKGVVWSTEENPTIDLQTKTNDGTGEGNFTSNMNNLSVETTYYVRAYATNGVGTAYGNQLSFTTGDIQLPIISTLDVSNITSDTATSGGDISSDGGGDILEKGVVWSTEENPTIDLQTKTNDGTGDSNFNSSISNLDSGTTYYLRAYATNSVGTAYGNELTFETNPELASITTTEVSDITGNSASSGGEITSNGGDEVTEKGVVWDTQQNPTVDIETKTNDGTGDGSFTSIMNNLSGETTYYVRAYATNSVGTAYGQEITFTTPIIDYAAEYPEGTVFCDGVITEIIDVTNPVTGKTWMDRNLGASQVASSSTDAAAYGDLYQWGRVADGHQCRDSETTSSLSSTDQPGHGDFILAPNSSYDWRSPQNTNLWQGVNGVNNPCPSGYRLPTEAELDAERLSWSSNDASGAFASPLKLPMAGYRHFSNGSLLDVGAGGVCWGSTVSGTSSRSLYFSSSSANIFTSLRARGISVRCLKD